jgi:very-short-patch-repair endonuclease
VLERNEFEIIVKKDKLNDMHFGADAFAFRKAEELRISMTKAEKVLWEEIRNNKLDGLKFRRQHPIGRFIVDFYCHKLKIVIELDGDIHKKGNIRENDINRQNELEELGLKIIRFNNNEVINNIANVIKTIQEVIQFEQNNVHDTRAD